MRTALLIDGAFFLKRLRSVRGEMGPKYAASELHRMCRLHLDDRDPAGKGKVAKVQKRRRNTLYRIFFYDCPPLTKRAHNPITGASVDFSKSPLALWRLEFLQALKKLRKVALRMGDLSERGQWLINDEPLKLLLSGKLRIEQLKEDDVRYDIRQKGVDMRIGLDIASLAYKKQVDQIVLVAGDSDFVPAAKLARREGIDFILDPMWAAIRSDLHEHIDGLRSVFPRATPQDSSGTKSEIAVSTSEIIEE